jgi:hypothetical protein
MAKSEPQAIRFSAQVWKIQTIVDGGTRLTLDMGLLPADVLVALFEAKQPGGMLEVAAVAVKADIQPERQDDQEKEDARPRASRRNPLYAPKTK